MKHALVYLRLARYVTTGFIIHRICYLALFPWYYWWHKKDAPRSPRASLSNPQVLRCVFVTDRTLRAYSSASSESVMLCVVRQDCAFEGGSLGELFICN